MTLKEEIKQLEEKHKEDFDQIVDELTAKGITPCDLSDRDVCNDFLDSLGVPEEGKDASGKTTVEWYFDGEIIYLKKC